MPKEQELHLGKLAESLFGETELEIKPVGDTLKELAAKYNAAVGANDAQLAAHASQAVKALVNLEAGSVEALMLGHYLKHAEPLKR